MTIRKNHPRRLGDFMPALTAPIFGKKAALFGKLLAAWADIAGQDIATQAIPTDLKFKKSKDKTTANQAILVLGVPSAAVGLELSYQKQILMEKLNSFFGYAAISDIILTQLNNIMDNKTLPTAPYFPVNPDRLHKIEAATAEVQENDLQTALKNLGKAIFSRHKADDIK